MMWAITSGSFLGETLGQTADCSIRRRRCLITGIESHYMLKCSSFRQILALKRFGRKGIQFVLYLTFFFCL